jgi:hypothetical protein
LVTFLDLHLASNSAKIVAMYIERIPNRNSPPAVLLRESYREGGKVKKRTIANLSKLSDEVVGNLKLTLKGATAIKTDQQINRSTSRRFGGH